MGVSLEFPIHNWLVKNTGGSCDSHMKYVKRVKCETGGGSPVRPGCSDAISG